LQSKQFGEMIRAEPFFFVDSSTGSMQQEFGHPAIQPPLLSFLTLTFLLAYLTLTFEHLSPYLSPYPVPFSHIKTWSWLFILCFLFLVNLPHLFY
jgi:hypothetical protein